MANRKIIQDLHTVIFTIPAWCAIYTTIRSTLYHTAYCSTSIYVWVYIYIYTHTHTHIYIYIYIYIYIWIKVLSYYFISQFNILTLPLYIYSPTIILRQSAAIWPDFTISYCNKHCKLVGSHIVQPYGEYVCIVFYRIFKYCTDGSMMVVNDRNMSLFLNKKKGSCFRVVIMIRFWMIRLSWL